MSRQAIEWAQRQRHYCKATGRHVLVCLAYYADAAGAGAFPSIATLVRATGLCERTVRYTLRRLEARGLIMRGNQALASGRADRRALVYDLALERGLEAAPVQLALAGVHLAAAVDKSVDKLVDKYATGGIWLPSRGASGDFTGGSRCPPFLNPKRIEEIRESPVDKSEAVDNSRHPKPKKG